MGMRCSVCACEQLRFTAQELVLEIEYGPAVLPPKLKETVPHDDWCAGSCTLSMMLSACAADGKGCCRIKPRLGDKLHKPDSGARDGSPRSTERPRLCAGSAASAPSQAAASSQGRTMASPEYGQVRDLQTARKDSLHGILPTAQACSRDVGPCHSRFREGNTWMACRRRGLGGVLCSTPRAHHRGGPAPRGAGRAAARDFRAGRRRPPVAPHGGSGCSGCCWGPRWWRRGAVLRFCR